MGAGGSERVVGVVPTFRPPEYVIDRLTLIGAMVDAIVVSDDASPATFDEVLRRSPVPVVRHRDNQGIARSLNIGLNRALELDAAWLLTVDQDSHLPPDYVERLLTTAHAAHEAGLTVGVVAAETVMVAGTALQYPTREESGCLITAEVFQSGALWNVTALADIGGFEESFGIDAVDAAACMRLRQRGFRVVLSPALSFEHVYGTSRAVRVLGRTVMATGHSPERRTRMVRNRLRLLPAEARLDPAQAWRSLRRVAMNTVLAVSIEDNRWSHVKASLRGLLPRHYR